MKVPLAVPECGEEEINEVIEVIKSGWLTTASRCGRFEKDFARFVGVKHALPTRYQGHLIGNFGDITCFSFYANKTMTTGEGGMLCTDDDEIAKRVKVMGG
jgi:dTDP-4-amino-4,6-dideoxygalactose transaminase